MVRLPRNGGISRLASDIWWSIPESWTSAESGDEEDSEEIQNRAESAYQSNRQTISSDSDEIFEAIIPNLPLKRKLKAKV